MTRLNRSMLMDAPFKEVFEYASDWLEGVSSFWPTTCESSLFAEVGDRRTLV